MMNNSEWVRGNGKYMRENWIVSPTPDGWVIGRREHKELKTFTQVAGYTFKTSSEARRKADELRKRRGW